jgi:hypothetical protein
MPSRGFHRRRRRFSAVVIDGCAPKSQGSELTRRWREPDSFGSRSRKPLSEWPAVMGEGPGCPNTGADLWGTEGSKPSLSSGESAANLRPAASGKRFRASHPVSLRHTRCGRPLFLSRKLSVTGLRDSMDRVEDRPGRCSVRERLDKGNNMWPGSTKWLDTPCREARQR